MADRRDYSTEDSWVPFHLEVAQELIEGEWWLPEKRDELAQMIDDIRLADLSEPPEDDEYERWSPDPYSFYLAFNTDSSRSMRVSRWTKVEELLELQTEVPTEKADLFGMGAQWRWEHSLSPEENELVWELFRFAIQFDPLSDDVSQRERFVELFDRASSRSFLAGRRSRLISYFLYWIDPTKYLLIRRLSDLNLADDLGVSEKPRSGTEYLKALKSLHELGAEHGFSLLDVNRKSTTREMLGLEPVGEPAVKTYTIDNVLTEGVFLERTELERMERILRSKKNLILQGPPGVGKTFIARKLAYVLMREKTEDRITSVQFHQSYSYEDFVGGFRPTVKGNQMVFTRQDGPFLKVCKDAIDNPNDSYVVLIDEINRGNLSRVFGELLMLLEADKRKKEFRVTLQHRSDDDDGFFVPENIYIIGTMNLADRSLTGMNVAMRRRFGFVDIEPQFGKQVFTNWLQNETEMPSEMQEKINKGMAELNSTIAKDASLGVNYAVGHSFFCPPEGGSVGGWDEWYETVVDYEIRPLLREYWFDDQDTADTEADKLLRND